MSSQAAKQQIIDKIADSEAILVALSKNPSVDELSAALGLTIFLNANQRRTTAVFSGDIPPVLQFLEPEKTFENTVNSLRDFIIAISKDKADNLRMKVEGDKAKVYITPYKTTINESDLEFSQGDYNVEMVIALGVTDRDQLDQALKAHGRIFHDATVVSLSNGQEKSTLGSIDWYDKGASSLSEMAVLLTEAFEDDDKSATLDKSVATALLTGIVASTERFSNEKTTPRVMNLSSKLMAAGADQQLIANNLQAAEESDDKEDSLSSGADGAKRSGRGGSKSRKRSRARSSSMRVKDSDGAGSLSISHGQSSKDQKSNNLEVPRNETGDALDDVAKSVAADNQEDAVKLAEEKLAAQEAQRLEQADLEAAPIEEFDERPGGEPGDDPDKANSQQVPTNEEPSEVSGEQALRGPVDLGDWQKSQQGDEAIKDDSANTTLPEVSPEGGAGSVEPILADPEPDAGRTILSHSKGYVGDSEPTLPPVPINSAGLESGPAPSLASVGDATISSAPLEYEPTARPEKVITPPSQSPPPPPVDSTFAPPSPGAQTAVPEAPSPEAAPADNSALSAIEAALGEEVHNAHPGPVAQPAIPDVPAEGAGIDMGVPPPPPPPPPAPDFSSLPPAPDFTKLPPLPGAPEPDTAPAELHAVAVPPVPGDDPAQFQIPGQA